MVKSNSPAQRGRRALILLVILLFAILAVHVWLDRLYELKLHAALGYGAVYSKNMIIDLLTRYGGALIYALLGWASVRPLREVLPAAVFSLTRVAGIAVGWLIGWGMWSINATDWFLFFHHGLFHRVDPILHMDISFYVYVLPLLTGIIGRITGTLVLFIIPRAIFVAAVFAQQQFVASKDQLSKPLRRSARIVLIVVGGIFLLFSALAVLGRYSLVLTSGNGSFVYGPDFVTTHLTLPVFSWLHIAALLFVALSIFWLALKIDKLLPVQDGMVTLRLNGFRRPVGAGIAYIAVSILTAVVGGLTNSLYVHPNQNTVELPYIQHTINATRYALGVQNVHAVPFQPTQSITSADLTKDANAIANVRINDQGQTSAIYNQLQSFKNYFHFDNASVDRYNGQEVYVSARQINAANLPVQTWINRTLVYTHGYGLAASPVNQFDNDGLPMMWAKNTPMTTQAPLPKVTRPQIYFGTMNTNVIAPSKESEFDYPVQSQDATSHYTGGYGLPVAGNRLLLTWEQGTLKFFTSNQVTAKSQWLFDRNIYQRVQDIAPFLTYDHDAFPFIDTNGHIKWMLDAYTETPNIPYAQSYMGTAYIRNSVKVVMDAYTGKVTFYVVDKNDVLLQNLMKVYPTLFTTNVPADVALHFRYPKDLFLAQSQALTRYHMTNASEFYNQEDLWAISNQIYQQNQTQSRPPVYQVIRMPDRSNTSFVVSELFTPANKDNLNGWFVADNDPAHYGQLTLYQFPQSSLIFGPMQAENQIDSDPAISSQLTLWNQQGSHVVRGDLLLIPVGNTLMYVEPVYLVANRQNSLPQLERVIIDYNQQVFMNLTLGATLQDVLNGNTAGNSTISNQSGTSGASGTSAGGTGVAGSGTAPGLTGGLKSASQLALVAQANALFKQYEADTAKGNFQAAGLDLSNLGQVLQQLAASKQQQK